MLPEGAQWQLRPVCLHSLAPPTSIYSYTIFNNYNDKDESPFREREVSVRLCVSPIPAATGAIVAAPFGSRCCPASPQSLGGGPARFPGGLRVKYNSGPSGVALRVRGGGVEGRGQGPRVRARVRGRGPVLGRRGEAAALLGGGSSLSPRPGPLFLLVHPAGLQQELDGGAFPLPVLRLFIFGQVDLDVHADGLFCCRRERLDLVLLYTLSLCNR